MKQQSSKQKRNRDPTIIPYVPPRFAVGDPDGYAYLEEHGYAVFKDVLSPEQVLTHPHRHVVWALAVACG